MTTKIKEKNTEKTRAHTQYRLKDGTIVPGASTVAKMLDSSGGALIAWAYNCGRAGIDYRKERDFAAEIGTLSHYRLLCHHKKQEPELKEYSPETISQSDNCLISYFQWEKGHKLETIFCEKELISEKYKFGGCIDWYGICDGVKELIDYKTSKKLYDNYWLQLAGYSLLLEENGYAHERGRLINIPRKETDEFADAIRIRLDTEKQIFIKLCEIYQLQHNGGK